MNGWLVFFGLLWAYLLLIFWLVRSGRMEKWNLSLMLGFILMIRTQKGKKLIDAIAKPKRFWNVFGDVGIFANYLGMFLMVAFVLWSIIFLFFQAESDEIRVFSASEIFVIPGVNPFIPLWYGLIGLIVTLVVHEGGHGVLARANNLKVKSLGLLWAIAPIGAFVEPDEDELKEASRRKRLRVFSAGPWVNMVVAAITLALFAGMIGAATPLEGIAIGGVSENGPIHMAGVDPGITITMVNGTATPDWDAFRAVVADIHPNQNVTIVAGGTTHQVLTGSRWDSLGEQDRQQILAEETSAQAWCNSMYGTTDGSQCAELATADAVFGFNRYPTQEVQDILSHPLQGPNMLHHISLPIGEVQGSPTLSQHLPAFYETPWNADIYWPVATVIFWVFWLNLMVGLFNMLPMLPLDGGHIFRDGMASITAKIAPKAKPETRERIVGRAASFMSFMILGALLLQILGPRFI